MKPKYLKLIRTPSGQYHLSGTINGQRVRESTGTRDQHEANAIAFRKEIELLYQSLHGSTQLNPLFSTCVKRYEKDVRYNRKNQGIVDRLNEHFGSMKVLDVDQDALDQFVKQVFVDQGMAMSTCARNLNILQAIRNHAVKARLVSKDSLPYLHIETPSKHNHRMSIVDFDTRDEIIRRARQPYADVFTFLWYTGARIGCALDRTWHHREQPGMRLYTCKGGRSKLRQRREYHVPEVAELTAMLDRRRREAQSQPGFSMGNKLFNVSDTAVRDELARICKEIGVEDFLPHDIRHCFGTYLALDDTDIVMIADLMGHDSLESARVYINYASGQKRKQMTRALSKPLINGGNVVSIRS